MKPIGWAALSLGLMGIAGIVAAAGFTYELGWVSTAIVVPVAMIAMLCTVKYRREIARTKKTE